MRRFFNKEERIQILHNFDYKCAYCGTPISQDSHFHADHIIPFSAGGVTCVSNGAPSCQHCNLTKGAKHEKTETMAKESRKQSVRSL
jgi:5-methylcytosine-specific restriction endonuclease McrA